MQLVSLVLTAGVMCELQEPAKMKLVSQHLPG